MITFRHGCSYRAILEHWLHEEGVRPQNRMELGTLDGIIGCVAAGLGITCYHVPLRKNIWQHKH